MSDETPHPAQPDPATAPDAPEVPAPAVAEGASTAPDAPEVSAPAVAEGAVLPAQPAPAAVPPPPSAYGYPGGPATAYPAWGTPPPPAPPRRRRRTALLVAGALVAVAAAGGGYALTRDGDGGTPAARPTATATPTPGRTYAVTAGGTHVGDLGRMLLPMPEGMRPGPDVEQFGNDTVLDAPRATSLLMGGDSNSRFSAAQRRTLKAQIDAMHVKGAALRTFRTADNKQTYQIELIQVGNKKAAAAEPEAFRKLAEGAGGLTAGPGVPGYPHAVCVEPDASDGSDDYGDSDDYDDYYRSSVDTMFCQATEGDLMVEFQAVGEAPLDEAEIPALLRGQLDRVKAPEEGV
ncbi:hypothetical protein [Streptomyces sp. NPDC020983]|uniref:hypothetical protein n=1 Tax=Streptomyces sp. NPDC020983 TaxID=3365106 RepID=UPI0037A0127A